MHVVHRDRAALSATEAHVRHCLEAHDVGWFPAGRALCLDEAPDPQAQSAEALARLEREVAAIKRILAGRRGEGGRGGQGRGSK